MANSFEVYWTKYAEFQLDSIFNFYSLIASRKVATKITQSLIHASLRLAIEPYINKIEPLLDHLSLEYRSLIHGHYKIIYRILETSSQVLVVDVFDCRQNPEKILNPHK
jgi:toxin ParE1/3/4